jgi:MFS family permease
VLVTLFIYGLLFGISMPISQVMISEITPVHVRGRFIVML